MPRLFIDCSLVDFRRIPTGIPRVVASYLEHGASWGARNGYEVYPVVFYGKEMILPFPMPTGLAKDFHRLSTTETLLRRIAQGLHDFIERFRKVIFHLLSFIGYLLFIDRFVRGGRLDRVIDRILKLYSRVAQVIPYLIERHYKRIVPQKGDILFSPAYWHDIDPEIYRNIRKSGCKIAILVHDILPIIYPQYYHYPWSEHFAHNLLASFSYADAHFAVSSYTRDCVMDFAKSHDVQVVNIDLAINGLHDLKSLDSLPRNAVPTSQCLRDFLVSNQTYLLMVGSIEPKKGHVHVIEQLSGLWQSGYDLPLLIIGRPGWMWESVVKTIDEHPLKDNMIYWFTDVSDRDLAIAYRQAQFLIFGSEAEGFGLPMIESLHFGCPVIALNTPISREVMGRFGLYYGKQEEQLKDLLMRLSCEDSYTVHRQAISDFRWPDWEDCTEILFRKLVSLRRL